MDPDADRDLVCTVKTAAPGARDAGALALTLPGVGRAGRSVLSNARPS